MYVISWQPRSAKMVRNNILLFCPYFLFVSTRSTVNVELTALKDHNLADMGISVMVPFVLKTLLYNFVIFIFFCFLFFEKGDRLRLMKEIKALKKKIKKSKEKDKKKSLKRYEIKVLV